MIYFEDLEIGATFSSDATYLVTEEEIVEFGRRWDPYVFHVDPEAASGTIFGGLVASSAHIFAIFVWFGHQFNEPTAAVSALGFNDLGWHSPVRPGDELHYRDTCTGKRLSKNRPGFGIVEFYSEIFNQENDLVFSTLSSSLIQCRPETE